MKNKPSKLLTLILLCLVGTALCICLYYFVDTVLNGSFLDWFERNYIITEAQGTEGLDSYAFIQKPNYIKLKRLLFWTLTGSVVVGLTAIYTVSHLYARVSVQRSVTQTSAMIHRFMNSDENAADLFPTEYAEISAQMAGIKSTMQRHEQILKEEAVRKNDLIVYLAHDLKTPLTSIIGYLSLLDEAADMPAPQRAKYVGITLNKALRLEQLINEFFEITRYNLQNIALEKETIDLCYLLVQLKDEFYPLLQARGNTVHLCVDENLTIYADAARLARVFNNLLKNAAAYSYPDTAIKIWAEQTDAAVKILFQNRGKTIPPNKLESVFEKFFRLDEARAGNTGGAGLGLAIAKEIVTLHGGTITAASQEERTTFCVTLPL